MPIRGPRKLYRINEIQVGEDAANTGGSPIFVKMKEPIGDFFGLTPVVYNDPALIGTFAGTGPNAGYTYVRKVGGFRFKSFTIVAKTTFVISELVRQEGSNNYVEELNTFRSISIGWPKGITVHEFLDWVGTRPQASTISYIVTPSGRSISFAPATT